MHYVDHKLILLMQHLWRMPVKFSLLQHMVIGRGLISNFVNLCAMDATSVHPDLV